MSIYHTLREQRLISALLSKMLCLLFQLVALITNKLSGIWKPWIRRRAKKAPVLKLFCRPFGFCFNLSCVVSTDLVQVLAIHTYILSDHRFYTHKTLVCRFVRLGVPTIELDAQGRSRPSICSLYNWRYRALGNLPHVLNHPDYQVSWDHSTAGKLGNFTLDLNQSDY